MPIPAHEHDKPSHFAESVKRPTSRDLSDLAADLRPKVEAVLKRLTDAGHVPVVFETYRSPERGAYLDHTGASRTGGKSLHCVSVDGARAARAVDIIDGSLDADGRTIAWGASSAELGKTRRAERTAQAMRFFKALGEAAAAEGLKWGGNWRSFPDLCHIEAPADKA